MQQKLLKLLLVYIICAGIVTLVVFIIQSVKKNMKKNMSSADRIIRFILAAVIAVLYFTNIITGNLGIVLLVVLGIFILTSVIIFCPLNALVGVKTCSSKK